MSNPILLQDKFTGMWRDSSRDDLPEGKVWDLEEYIPGLGAPLRKRGGWTFYGQALTAIDASAGTPARVGILVHGGANEIRTLRIEDGGGIGGTFTLTYSGQTTTGIAYNASASTIQTALEALSNLAPGDVVVSNLGAFAPVVLNVNIEFTGTLANTDIPGSSFTVSTAGLTGSSSTTLANTQNGGAEGSKVVVIDDRANPELFDLTVGADRGSVYGASRPIPMGPLVSYRDMLLIPSPELHTSPVGPRKYVAVGTVSALGGSPPGVRFFAIYKDRVVGASADMDTPNRVFFSAAGNAESWDTTNRYIDTSGPPIALAPLRNALLVFHSGSVERIRGDIPPGSAAANMTLEPLFGAVGLIDPDALTVQDEYVYWADDEGVYRSDGSSFTDLTKQGGISQYWRDLIPSATVSVALTVWRGYVWVSLLGASDVGIGFLVFDIEKRSWFRFNHHSVQAYNFVHRTGATDELYFSNRVNATAKGVGKLSTIFTDIDSRDADEGGSVISPSVVTPFYELGTKALKRWRNLYLTYFTFSDNTTPVTTVLCSNPAFPSDNIDAEQLASPPESAFNRGNRAKIKIGFSARGMGFWITTSTQPKDHRLFSLEANMYAQEGSRRRA